MASTLPTLVLLYVATGALVFAIGLAAWPRRATPGARIAILNSAVVASCWCWALAAQSMAPDVAGKLFWHKLRFLGAAIMPATFLLQVLECTGRRHWITWRRVLALAALPALATTAVLTSERHELAFHHLRLEGGPTGVVLAFERGPMLSIYLVFAVGCALAVGTALAETAVLGARPYRAQARVLLLMAALPWLSRMLPWPAPSLILSPGIQPLVFLPAAAIMWLAVFRLGLLDLVPMARGALVAGLSDALIVLDRQSRVIELNPAAERTLAVSAGAAVGRQAREAFAGWPGWPILEERLERAPQAGFEVHAGARAYEAKLTPIGESYGGPAAGRLLLLHDITERVQAQAELARARAEAEAANSAKGEFLARMGHEVRTPLQGVLGLAELLLESPLEPEQRRRALALRRAGRVLLAVLDDILEAARLEAGGLELALEDFDPRAVVEDVVELFAPQAAAKALRLEARCPGLPASVRGDPARIHQALANLVSNALKFTREGGVTITAAASVDGLIRFEVADTGPGVPEQARERLFHAFAQADAFTATRFGGSGLGLAICRQLAELMGGAAGFERAERGSVFWFSARLEASVASVAAPARFQGRVLVADDHPQNRLVLEKLLTRFGCHVDLASNGRQAVERATASQPFDLALLDVQMPELDGPSAAAEIRRREGHDRRTPLVALSAGAVPGDDPSFDAHVLKPVGQAELQALLGRFLAPAGGPVAPCSTPDELESLWPSYLVDARGSLLRLERLAASGDLEAFRREAHRLKGSSLFLGAAHVAELCEGLTREGAGLGELRRELERLEAARA